MVFSLTSQSYRDMHGYEKVPVGQKNYIYSSTTGSSNLRKHLMKEHYAAYKEACVEHGWTYCTPKVKQPTVGENWKRALPPFSAAAFLEYLVRFVTADDQVSVTAMDLFNRNLMMCDSRSEWLNVLSSGTFACC